jgi:hypothetical protein
MNVRIRRLLLVVIGLVSLWNATALGQWSDLTPLTEINTAFVDKSPFLSFDGLTLYFSRQNLPEWYYTSLYQATRPTPDAPFGAVSEISELKYFGGHVDSPWVSPDNLRLYYFRTEPGSQSRLKLSQRTSVHQGWPQGDNLSELNALGYVAHPTLSADELTIVFAGKNLVGGIGGYDLWMATRAHTSQAFGNAINLSELNSGSAEYHPALAADGLALYFASDRNGSLQVFEARRASVDVPFGWPEVIPAFDSPDSIADYPFVSSDGREFYLTQNFGAGPDIHVAFRAGEPPEPNQPLGSFYVNAATGHDNNSGRSPEAAFATIQRGINVANTGDVVVVANGLYAGSGNRNLSFGGRIITLRSANGPADTIIDCQNAAQGFVFQNGESPSAVLDGFTIINGSAQRGGGIYCLGSSPTIRNCVVSNCSGYYCAGIYCRDGSSAIIYGCTIVDNIGTYGGGIRCVNSSVQVINCLIANNSSSSAGAGIKCDYGNGSPIIMNCTVAGNSSSNYGGGLWSTSSNPIVSNCIFWDNISPGQGSEIAVGSQSILTVTYSDVQSGQTDIYRTSGGQVLWGEGNFDQNPLFVDPNQGDYHLQSERGRYWETYNVWALDQQTSPCIDAGDPTDDYTSERTPHGNQVNMGAYGGTGLASLSLAEGGTQPLEGDFNGDGFIDMTDLFALIDAWLAEFAMDVMNLQN